jgi:phytoene dehydrogenase-like protein
MAKKVIIIGAGIAGLSAGCYARMNGYDAEIFEAHTQSGGLCTAWERKGYTIDGCLHWLTGSNPNYSFYQVWAELGAVQGRRMINHEVFSRITGADGKVFIVYCDAVNWKNTCWKYRLRMLRTSSCYAALSAASPDFRCPLANRSNCIICLTSYPWW